MATPRILLAGDALGRLNQLFKRVSSVSKSAGPFDVLFCVGQFFPESPEQLEEFCAYIEGNCEIPMPTYFIGDYGVGAAKFLSAVAKESSNLGFKMDGFKVCQNLYWLKGSGKFTVQGLSIAYLSGRRAASDGQFGVYSQDDIDSLRALSEESGIVDIFLTNEWPHGVTNGASTSKISSLMLAPTYGDSAIAELVAELKPRYHIAGTMGVFFDREPYANVGATHVTRFIALAPVGNKDKQKFVHGLSLNPASNMPPSEMHAKPPNTTLSPYTLVEETGSNEKRRFIDATPDEQYWRYDVSQKKQKLGDNGDKLCFKYISSGSCTRGEQCHFRHDEDAREQCIRGVCFDFLNKGKCERGPDCKYKHSLQEAGQGFSGRRSESGTGNANRSRECWFCLSSPNVESHLITSIGEYFYCALPKGPLVEDHVLIVPIEHQFDTLHIRPECEKELSILQSSLRDFFKSKEQEVVFFEWAPSRGTHANLQAVPVPLSKAPSVERIFKLAAKKLGFTFETIKGNTYLEGRKVLGSHLERSNSLFYAEVPGGLILERLVKENEKFPTQFGREVMAGLLNLADKADWRNCQVSKHEEEKMAEDFRIRYKEYDPNSG